MNFKFAPKHTFFTSDTHFNHANIIHFCNCPFKNVEQMNETIIANWNSVIKADDTIFHLGDFCLGGASEWTKVLDRLNGKIYLIMGNHDLKNLRQGFINRFEHVAMQMHITVGKQRIYLCHYPFLCFEGGYREVWQLFGHVHTRINNTGLDAERLQYLYPTQYDVGVDNNAFTPVSYEQVNQIIKKQLYKQNNYGERESDRQTPRSRHAQFRVGFPFQCRHPGRCGIMPQVIRGIGNSEKRLRNLNPKRRPRAKVHDRWCRGNYPAGFEGV